MQEKEMMALLKGVESEQGVRRVIRENYQDVKVANGHTKIVLIAEKGDYVIKFWRRDTVRYDYCTREAKIYQKAVKWGLQELFAPTIKVGYIEKGVPYYQQPRIETFGFTLKGNTEVAYHPTVKKKLRHIISEMEYYSCDSDWFAYVLKSYGEVTLIKLIRFLKENKINDLRNENVGFKDGKPIIVDYSGFHGGNKSRW